MTYTVPRYIEILKKDKTVLNPDFFEMRPSKVLNTTIWTPKLVLSFAGGVVRLGYNVGTRGKWY